MKWRRVFLPLLAGMMAVALSGCASFGADVSMYLRPPQAAGEQGLIEQALSEYMTVTLAQENYILKYPRSGENRSAFLVEDIDGDGKQEALAFYSFSTEGSGTHINLLCQTDNKWESVYDYESSATDIHSVCFGDTDGDGVRELFVSWDMYSSRTYQLSMYTLEEHTILPKFTTGCTSLAVADFTGDGRDDCLLFDAGVADLTAKLWSMNDDTMEQIGQCGVAGYVQKLCAMHIIEAAENRAAVLMDYALTTDTVSAALVYWNGSTLTAPLYDVNDATYVRPAEIPLGDIDGDGVWEWPSCTPLSSYGEEAAPADTTGSLTTFWSWDFESDRIVEKVSCIYNAADRYYLLVDNTFSQAFTTTYDAESHTMWVMPLAGGEPLLAIRAKYADEPEQEVDKEFGELVSGEDVTYLVWYAEENESTINMETLQYMFTLL